MHDFNMEAIAEKVEARFGNLQTKKIFLGFDAFVDQIARPIRTGNANRVNSLFETMDGFGRYLIERSGKNCSIELLEAGSKIGGNMPICANTLSSLGVETYCVGTFGVPEINLPFREMHRNCHLVSVGNPGVCVALEFENGKIMLGMNKGVNSLSWNQILEQAGLEALRGMVESSEMLCFLNWSELPGSTEIFRGMSKKIFADISREKTLLIDLSDAARRKKGEIIELLETIAGFPKQIKTILSLNRNEAVMVCSSVGIDPMRPDGVRGRQLIGMLNLAGVVFHRRESCTFVTKEQEAGFETIRKRPPVISTGAGDNFNAGVCAALLMELEPCETAAFASLVAGYYVENGHSAEPIELLDYIKGIRLNTNYKRRIKNEQK